ncbi:hypothetical protein [Desulfatibacillum aliphaticivorans]|uniref:hypothetical protein n=1 Tax=Desulfatibacillum aliphaticivorans TaxID=218208 RepID=UPI0004243535|nr:hypothetical protein [Desulfatibacillum aliphaticivorans]
MKIKQTPYKQKKANPFLQKGLAFMTVIYVCVAAAPDVSGGWKDFCLADYVGNTPKLPKKVNLKYSPPNRPIRNQQPPAAD